MSTLIRDMDTVEQRKDTFVRFVAERDAIRIKKERGDPRPWTNDDVLHEYSFCNVRRADDRVTKWIGEWVQDWDPAHRWMACAVARWINEPETLKDLPCRWLPIKYKALLEKKVDHNVRIFRAAYIINGYPGMPKYISVIDKVLHPLWQGMLRLPSLPDSFQASWLLLRNYPGHGSFMAGQIAFDWHTFGIIKSADAKTWAPLGPGSIKGLNIIYAGDADAKKVSQSLGVDLMQQLFDLLKQKLPSTARRLDLMDVQNCCCEFQKYVRGGSKQKYAPYTEKFL